MTSAETTTVTGHSGPASSYAEARLRLLHERTRSGPPRRAELARTTDRWLAGLLASGAGGAPAGVALVAVGGYGRGELSPRSDLDLLLLHDGTLDPGELAALADRLWYPVWDMGLDLDHSVRTSAQAAKTAEEDLRAHLGLLDARHLAGDAGLTAGLRSTVLAAWRNRATERLPELRELCRERARRHGELQFLLEPDLKEARGGLRDLTVLRAVAASWLADAPRHGLAEARTRLLDVRDALHLTTGRATDRLVLHDQDQVADHLGLLDADVLLRQVYEAARTVAHADDMTWREVGRVLRARSGRSRLRGLRATLSGGGRAPAESVRTPLAEGVVEQEGEAGLARTARPERDPVLPLRAAAAAAQAGLPLSLAAVRRMAASGCRPLPEPWPAEARELLVTLLGAGEATVPVWETLEAEGLITRLLPDWERVRCRPQRNPVHRWTVDRHLVETAVRASELTRRVGRPDLLLVAALLHDIGKGWPGDHSVVGETIARDMAERIGFAGRDAAVLGTLVRHHLLLVETATRRDLDDPATVQTVAEAVGDIGTLEILHALTEADARATGPGAWGSWRATLVGDLVRRVTAVLGGVPPEPPAEDAADVAHERLAHEALSTGGPVLALQAEYPDPEGAEAADDAGRTGAAEPVGVELVIAVPAQEGVLPAAAGVLALHRLRVRAADLRLLTLPGDTGPDNPGAGPGTSDVLLLAWRVSAVYGSLPEAVRLRKDLARALDGSLDVPGRLAEREAAHPSRRGVPAPPPRVTVAPAGSRLATVIEVRAQDVPGLLHRIGLALESTGVQVRSAHVSTLGANAVDAFYVTDSAGAPLPTAVAAAVARAVEDAIRA